jgi:sarcosine oxidase subunit alpha
MARISFSGELSYEINLRASRANHFLAKALAAGGEFGLTPYGIEALMTLRLEKGYLHVGSDTDGETTPDDVGWGRQARKKPTDFIGRRSLFRPANLDPDRKQLIGLVAQEADQVMRAGAHLLLGEHRQAPAVTDGWITSAAFSPSLGRHIALAMLRAGRSQQANAVTVIDEDVYYTATVVATPFWDADNKRLKQ